MKQLKTFLFILSIAFIASCSPKEESPNIAAPIGGGTGGGGTGGGGTGGGPIANPLFRATISGDVTGSFNATFIEATDSGGYINITGYDANFSCTINFLNTIGTSGSLEAMKTLLVDKSNFSIYPYISGSNGVSISSFDKTNHTIKGTFYFDGGGFTGTANVKSGVFEVNYTVK